tara:strand:+ start:311 stop:574 length:264 start_codon:yes stop_codon:yes gene_type:complete
MKISNKLFKKIIKEEVKGYIAESQSKEQVVELSGIIDTVDDIANKVYQSSPELAKELGNQVQRLANVHDKLEALLRDTGIVDRRPDF